MSLASREQPLAERPSSKSRGICRREPALHNNGQGLGLKG